MSRGTCRRRRLLEPRLVSIARLQGPDELYTRNVYSGTCRAEQFYKRTRNRATNRLHYRFSRSGIVC